MFYWPLIWTFRILFSLLTRFRVHGRENVPVDRPFVFVSNHISHFDPPVFSAACPRAIDWMGADLLFRKSFWAFVFRNLNVIKVRQYEADQQALREAARRAKAGRCVGLFPEGGIRAGEKSVLGAQIELYEGAFMIAVLAGVPILPCLVVGSDRLYHPSSLRKRVPIWARFGEPIEVRGKGREEVARLKDAALVAIRKLAEELRAEGEVREDDWPKTPQERNPNIPHPKLRIEN